MSQRHVSNRRIITVIWGLLSFAGLGAGIGVAVMKGPAGWVFLGLLLLQFLFCILASFYSLGREDERLGLVNHVDY